MKVALLVPESPFLIRQNVMPPLGVWYLSAVLKWAGHKVDIFDLGLGDPILAGYDVYGVTGTSAQVEEIEVTLYRLKDERGLKVIGGPHATLKPWDMLQLGFDTVVCHEGEEVISEIVAEGKTGVFWAEEARQLYNGTRKLPKGSLVVEVGCSRGRSTSVLAMVARKKNHQFYVCDNWRDEGEKCKAEFWENMYRIGADEMITFLEMASVAAAEKFEERSIDFLHLDSDHSYDMSVAELKAWIPKMKRSAVMAFHDYENVNFADGIKRAVDEADLIKLGVYNSLGVFQVPERG